MEVGDEESLRVQGVHNHPPDVCKRKAKQLTGDMHKRAKRLVHTSIDNIYKKTTAATLPHVLFTPDGYPVAREETFAMCDTLPSAYNFAASLLRARRVEQPVLPQECADINFDGRPNAINILIDTGGGDDRIIVISNTSYLRQLCEAERVHMDGTLKTCPNLFSQLFIIHALVGNQTLPLLDCLLSAKDSPTYTRLFRLIVDKANELGMGGSRIIDYEAAIARSLRYVVRGVTIKGCYFHYCQALRRRYQRLGLTNYVYTPGTVRTVIYRLMCLPFVLVEDVVRVFEVIENPNGWDVLYDGVHGLLVSYLRYFRRTWIESAMGLERWNVWSTDTTTNNAIEAYNGKLNKECKPHPNFFHILDFLSMEISVTYWTSMSDDLEKKFRPQRYPQLTEEERIRAAKAAYRRGDFQEMNVMIYLDNIVEIYHPAGGRGGRGRGGANAVANGGPLAEAYAEVDNEEHQQDDIQEQEQEQHEELLLAEKEMWGVDGDTDLNENEEDEATRFGDVFEEEIGE